MVQCPEREVGSDFKYILGYLDSLSPEKRYFYFPLNKMKKLNNAEERRLLVKTHL